MTCQNCSGALVVVPSNRRTWCIGTAVAGAPHREGCFRYWHRFEERNRR